MHELKRPRFLELSNDAQTALVAGARDGGPVRGLTHGFYKYPARFSPVFAAQQSRPSRSRATSSLIPMSAAGLHSSKHCRRPRSHRRRYQPARRIRRSVKCTVFSEAELDTSHVGRRSLPSTFTAISHVRGLRGARLLQASQPSLALAAAKSDRSRASPAPLARLTPRSMFRPLCRVASSPMGARRPEHCHVDEFREWLMDNATRWSRGARELRAAVRKTARRRDLPAPQRCWLEESHPPRRAPRLVVTSPPYPGVHVLYHRWQVDGRKEAPLPFMIANKLDGAGSSYYTMGDRKYPELKTYFDNIRATMSSVAALADANTMSCRWSRSPNRGSFPTLSRDDGGRRSVGSLPAKTQGPSATAGYGEVPGRRWYSDQRGETPGSQEVVLIHRKDRC